MKVIFPLMLFLLAGTILPRAMAEENEPVYKQLNSRAIAAFRSGEHESAEKLYKEALGAYSPEKDHYDQTIKRNLAVLYRRMGKTEEAQALEISLGDNQSPPAALVKEETGEASNLTPPKVPTVAAPPLIPLVAIGTATIKPSPARPASPKLPAGLPPAGATSQPKAAPLSTEDARVLTDYCTSRGRTMVMAKHPSATKVAAGTAKAVGTGRSQVRVDVRYYVTLGGKIVAEQLDFLLSTKNGDIGILSVTSNTLAAKRPSSYSSVARSTYDQAPTAVAPATTFADRPTNQGEEDEYIPPPPQQAGSILSGFDRGSSNTSFGSSPGLPGTEAPDFQEPPPTDYSPPGTPPSGGG